MPLPAASLDRLFAPASVAVIGASSDRTKIRGILLEQLRAGGYKGAIYPVNPGTSEIGGLRCYPTIGAIGAPVDLAIVAIPTENVMPTLEACAVAGVAHALVLTSGFAEQGGEQADLQDEIGALARRTGMRICGPNSVGFYSARAKLAATFSPTVEPRPDRALPKPSGRRVGIVSQSGGLAFTAYDYGRRLGLGFSHIVNTGNEVDVTLSDVFAHLVADLGTQVILLLVEGIRDPATFLAAAQAAAIARKPVIVCKIGRSQAGARAAASHTANMAGWDAAYGAVFRTYGIVVASDPEEMSVLAAAFATAPPAKGGRIGIVTVSGGTGALAADVLTANGLTVPELGAAARQEIARTIPAYGSTGNPVDVTAQGSLSGGLGTALSVLAASEDVDQILVVASLASEARVGLDLDALRDVIASCGKPVLVYTYTRPSGLACRALAEVGIVPSLHLTWTAHAMRALMEFGNFLPRQEIAPWQETNPRQETNPWQETNTRHEIAPLAASSAILDGLGPDGATLSEHAATSLLTAFGIAGLAQRLAADEEAAVAAAAALSGPVALKIQSPDIPHKTEAGGVQLNLASPDAVRQAYRSIMREVGRNAPAARIAGCLVQRMAPAGIEIIVGTVRDPVFGVILTVGAGGVAAELHRDTVSRHAPVSPEEATAMLSGLRAYRLLTGWRGAPAADVAALANLVSEISRIAVALGDRVSEIELNPVLVHPEGDGCSIADALIAVAPREAP